MPLDKETKPNQTKERKWFDVYNSGFHLYEVNVASGGDITNTWNKSTFRFKPKRVKR